MGLIPWNQTVTDDLGNVIPEPVVTVRDNDGATFPLSSLYDADGNSISNPITGGLDGFVQFYVRAGSYQIVGNKGGSETQHNYWDAIDLDVTQPYANRAAAVAAWAARGDDVKRVSWVTSGGVIGVVESIGATAISDMDDAVPDGVANPEHWAENTTPGTTDMTTAAQAAIDYCATNNRSGAFRATVYAVTGLQWKQGARFTGAGNWSGVSSLYQTVGTTVFKYIGTGGANSCVINVSSLAVGTEGTATDQIQNIGLAHVTVDGNALAEFGFYFNRSWSNNQFDYLTATGTLKHGFWAGNCWNGSPTNWHAFKNIGAGITLGINSFGWSQCTVDQSVCTSFFGYYSGHNASTVAQNAFNESGGEALEHGLGVGNGRGLVLVNPQANECGGAGFYREGGALSPLTVIGGYFENNGKSSSATRRWDLWYISAAGQLNDTFRGIVFGVAATGAIKITGTPNTTRLEASPVFESIPVIGTIDADHAYYRLVDCDRDPVAVVGSAAMYFGRRRSNAQNLDAIGQIVFHTTTGAITELRKEGAISSMAYDGVGDFTLTLSSTQADGRWIVLAFSAADNRYVRAHTFTTTTCKISHKSCTTNTAADPEGSTNAIRLVVFPSYA